MKKNYVIVRSWDYYEEDLEGFLSEIEKLDPTIKQRWQPDLEAQMWCDNIHSLIAEAKLPEGFIFWSDNDAFAILAPVVEIRVHKVVEQHYPHETFGNVLEVEVAG